MKIVSYDDWVNALERQCALSHREMRDVSICIIECEEIDFQINFNSLRKSDLVGSDKNFYYIILPECGIDEAVESIVRCFDNTSTNSLFSANAIEGLIAKVASWNHSESVLDFVKRASTADVPTDVNLFIAKDEMQPSKLVVFKEDEDE